MKTPGYLGQQHEQPRPDEERHLCGEGVIVAERDLVGRSRVVLVDHRNGAQLEQRLQRVPRVDVRRTIGDVRRSQEHLACSNPLPCERPVPGGLKPCLP